VVAFVYDNASAAPRQVQAETAESENL